MRRSGPAWLSFERLARSSPRPEHLATVLGQEERQGRLAREGECWRIVPEAFAPDLLQAVAMLDEVGSWSGPGRQLRHRVEGAGLAK